MGSFGTGKCYSYLFFSQPRVLAYFMPLNYSVIALKYENSTTEPEGTHLCLLEECNLRKINWELTFFNCWSVSMMYGTHMSCVSYRLLQVEGYKSWGNSEWLRYIFVHILSLTAAKRRAALSCFPPFWDIIAGLRLLIKNVTLQLSSVSRKMQFSHFKVWFSWVYLPNYSFRLKTINH